MPFVKKIRSKNKSVGMLNCFPIPYIYPLAFCLSAFWLIFFFNVFGVLCSFVRSLAYLLGCAGVDFRLCVVQAALHEVYGDDVELCDVLVGNLAEDKIDGFAIRYMISMPYKHPFS